MPKFFMEVVESLTGWTLKRVATCIILLARNICMHISSTWFTQADLHPVKVAYTTTWESWNRLLWHFTQGFYSNLTLNFRWQQNNQHFTRRTTHLSGHKSHLQTTWKIPGTPQRATTHPACHTIKRNPHSITHQGTRSIVTLRFGSNFAVWQ
jgi:hypothetical protein